MKRGAYTQRPGGNPSLVLLDQSLPKRKGTEVLREIKSSDQLRKIPVVVFTGSQQERDMIESYDLGANAYVVKPMDMDDFIVTIGELGLFWGEINRPADT